MPAKKKTKTTRRTASRNSPKQNKWQKVIANSTRALRKKKIATSNKIELLEKRSLAFKASGALKEYTAGLEQVAALRKIQLAEGAQAYKQARAEREILSSIAQALVDQADLNRIGQIVGEKVQQFFNAEIAGIGLYDSEAGMIHVPYYYERGVLKNVPSYEFGKGVTSHVLKTRKPIYLPTAQAAKKYNVMYSDELPAETMLMTPILSGKKALGVLSIQHSQRYAYGKPELEILTAIANSMAVAIENAHLFAETNRRNAELAVITSIQTALADELDIQAIYDTVGEKLREIFKVGAITINVYDLEADTNSYVYGFEDGKRTPNIVRPIAAHHRFILDQGEIFLLNTGAKEFFKRFNAKAPQGKLPKSGLSVRLPRKGNRITSVTLMDIERENVFARADVRLLQTLANSMSVALENARLFSEIQKGHREVSEALDQQNATSDILRALASSPTDPKPVLTAVAQQAARLCDANDVQVYRVEGDQLRQITHFGPLPALQDGEGLPLVPGLVVGKVVLERKEIHLEDASKLSPKEFPESVKLQRRLGHRTTLGVPLLLEGKAIGAIVVRRNVVRPFTEKQISLLKTFADQAAIAIEKARLLNETNRLLEETTQRNAELAVINSVQQGLAGSLKLQEIIDLVGEKVGEIFQADTVSAGLVDEERDWGSHIYYVDRGRRVPIPDGPTIRPSLTALVLDTKQPLHIGTYEESEKLGAVRNSPSEGEQDQNESILMVPIQAGEKTIGAISVQSYKRNAFTSDDLRLLQTLAGSMSVALENARLFDETAQRNAELAIINSVQEALASKLDMQAVYELVGDKIREIFHADTTLIAFHDENREKVIVPYYVDRNAKQPFTRPYGRGLYEPVVESGKPLLLNTEAEADRVGSFRVISPGAAKDLNESVMWVPIFKDGKAIGATSVQSYQQYAYNGNDLRLLTTLTNSMSVALENARLFDETAQRNAELAVINSVQAAMAQQMDIKGIYEAVGEKIRDIFDAQSIALNLFDETALLVIPQYLFENGERLSPNPGPFSGLTKQLIAKGETILINQDLATKFEKDFGYVHDPSWGAETKSGIWCPLLTGEKVIGEISIQNINRENAFGPNDVRLLETIANSMSVALENARLFDETAQRNAELAVINSVQEAMSKQLDINGIYEAVGEKIKDIFHAEAMILAAFDLDSRLVHPYYFYENGERFFPDPFPFTGLISHLVTTQKSVVINENFAEKQKELGMRTVAGADTTKSGVFVPLVTGSKVIGGISLQSDHENAFSPSAVRLLETLANGMSVALENARLFDETSQRNAELAIINSVQEGIASKLDVHAIYELVGEKLSQVFPDVDVTVGRYDPTTDMAIGEYMVEHGKRIQIEPFKVDGVGFLGELVRQPRTQVVNENMEQAMEEVGSFTIEGTGKSKSFVNVPLVIGGVLQGLLQLQDMYREHAFSDSDVRLLETIANSVSIALENARLFDETQRLLDESRKKEEELSTINTVSQAVASELELASLIELIGVQVRKIFKADIAYLALYDEEKDLIEFPYLFGDDSSPVKMGEGIVSRVIREGKPLLINRDEAWQEAEQKLERVGVKSLSYLGVPIFSGKRSIGAISVQSTKITGRFDEEDQHLLSTIAANVGAAIENARLFAEVARQKKYFETFFQYSPAAVVVVDFNGNVISWNPAAEGLFGYSAQEAIGRNVDDLVANDPQILADARAYTKRATDELGRIEVIGRRTRKNGSFVDVEVKALPISVEGTMLGLLVIYHDISEIEGARRAAEEANQAKSAFLANMSHELRTPLNAIIGFTRIVRRKGGEALPEKQLENLDKVLVSAEHLLGLINTILDIAKIEAGRMELQLNSFNLPALVEGVLATSQPLAKPGVQLLSSLPPDIPHMHSDEEKIRQVLLNLLSNAAKFTHQGSITIKGELKGDQISLAVQDTGIGIAPENLAKIFEEFQQADNTTTREYGGTGLGLSISRSLAKLLGGDLTVASAESEGSTFTLTLPIRLSAAAAVSDGKEEIAQPALEPDKPVILVIDDQPDMFHILQQNLGDAGYQVVGALSGEEGIEKARSLHPFAITLDIMMPRKDGWQVLHELKNDPQTKDIPVIILTIVDNKPMGFRLGASDYLVKPLSERSVLDALQRLAKSNGGVHPRKLLVVDDDPTVVDMVQQMLGGEDFAIETAADGVEALARVAQSQPDAILLDLLMPRMDGFQFIDELQKQPRNIPVIVLTAKTLTSEEQLQLEKSVVAIVQKQGLGSDTLIEKIRQTVPGIDAAGTRSA